MPHKRIAPDLQEYVFGWCRAYPGDLSMKRIAEQGRALLAVARAARSLDRDGYAVSISLERALRRLERVSGGAK